MALTLAQIDIRTGNDAGDDVPVGGGGPNPPGFPPTTPDVSVAGASGNTDPGDDTFVLVDPDRSHLLQHLGRTLAGVSDINAIWVTLWNADLLTAGVTVTSATSGLNRFLLQAGQSIYLPPSIGIIAMLATGGTPGFQIIQTKRHLWSW